MLKKILTAGSVVALLLAVSCPSYAQTPQGTLQDQTQASPQNSPNSQQVSPEELQKFATAFKQLLQIELDSQQQIVQAVQNQGLSEQRFTEIFQAQRDPKAKPSQAISAEEKQRFDQVMAQAMQIRQQNQLQQEQAIKSQGFNEKRFNEILAVVQQDPSLMQKVRELVK